MGNEIYESQTQHVFNEFIKEVLDDVFYSGEDIHSPVERLLLDPPRGGNALIHPPKNAISVSRLPSLQQILEINRLYDGNKHGNYALTKRAVKEARSKEALTELFHYSMRKQFFDTLTFNKKEDRNDPWQKARSAEAITRHRKAIVTMLLPAVNRLYPGLNVSEFMAEFMRTRLNRLMPADRSMARTLFAFLKDIDTAESKKVLQELANDSRASSFLRSLAQETIGSPSTAHLSSRRRFTTPPLPAHHEPIELDEGTVKRLKEVLATPPTHRWSTKPNDVAETNAQFEAATRLYDAGRLEDSDIPHIARAVGAYYWRYREGDEGEKLVHTLLRLAPTRPEVFPILARATETGWGYPAQEIAVEALKHGYRDPHLMEAFRDFIGSGIADRFETTKVIEALGRLGDVKAPRLVETLQRTAQFVYVGHEPEKESYEAVIALGRLGANDPKTIAFLQNSMREHEDRFLGAGVPFAAALAMLGAHDAKVIYLLERELTHNPDGQRPFAAVAAEALSKIGRANPGSAAYARLTGGPKDCDDKAKIIAGQ